MTSQGWAIGVEIGGTALRIGLVDARGEVKHSVRKESIRLRDQSHAPDLLHTDIENFLVEARVNLQDCAGIGIAAAGLVNDESGTVVLASNLGWRDFRIGSAISELTQLRTVVDKDTNMAAIGELAVGAGKHLDSFIYASVGTGVGGAVIYDGKLLRGIENRAGEFGHVIVGGNEPCGCGLRGCLETAAGGASIARHARDALAGGARSKVRVMVGGRLDEITAQMVVEAAEQEDTLAQEILARAAQALGIALLNTVRMIYPQAVILGGSVGSVGRFIFEPVRKFVETNSVFPGTDLPPVRLLQAGLGDAAAVVGAGLAVFTEGP